MPLPRIEKLCGARGKRSSLPCKNPAVSGADRCRMHGGRSLSGRLAPGFKHGQYCPRLYDRIAGSRTIAFVDTIRNQPEKLARVGRQIIAECIAFGKATEQDLKLDHLRLEHEAERKASGVSRVKLSPQERKKRRLEREQEARERHRGILPVTVESSGGPIPPFGQSIRSENS